MIKVFKAPNGIKIATYKISQVKSIHMTVIIKGGSLVEEPEKSGVAHFMEHMLVQGIPSFTSGEKLAEYIEGLSGRYNAYTDQLTVSFAIRLPFIHIEDAIKIASEVFFEPLFPKEAIEKEREAIITEIIQDQDSLGYKLHQEFKEIRFKKNSIVKKDVGGRKEIVEKITREDMQEYWRKYFSAENVHIYIGGNFSDSKLNKLLKKYFYSRENTHSFPNFPMLSNNDFAKSGVFIKENKKLGTNYLTISFPSLSLNDDWKDIAIQDLALSILGQLRTSRLFSLLRYKKGLVYNISGHRTLFPGLGYTYINSETSTENMEEVLSDTMHTLYKFIKHGPTQKELDFVKDYYINTWLMAFDNPASVADWMEGELLWEDKVRLPEDYIEMIKTVNLKDVLSLIQERWNLDKLQILIQGPVKEKESLIKKFEKLLNAS